MTNTIGKLNKLNSHNEKCANVFAMIFLVCVVLSSGSTFNILNSTLVTGMLILSCIAYIIVSDLYINKKNIIFIIVLIGFWFLQCGFDTSAYSLVIKYSVKTVCILFFSSYAIKNKIDVIGIVSKIIFVCSIASFVVYLLLFTGIPLPTITGEGINIPTVFYLNGVEYSRDLGIWLYRNCGIFWEPGLYQVYLNFILFYYLFKNHDYIKSAFIIINVLTTFSIAGIAVCGVLVLIYLYTSKYKKAFCIALLIFAMLCILILLPIFLEVWLNKTETGSFSYRTKDITYGIKVGMQTPIFGSGLSSTAYAEYFLQEMDVYRGNSNGVINIFLWFGIFGLIFFTYAYKKTIDYINSYYNIKVGLAFTVFIFASLMNEPITTLSLPMLLVGLGMNYKFAETREKEKRKLYSRQGKAENA